MDKTLLRLLALAAGAVALSGCASLDPFEIPTTSKSPAAQRTEQLVRTNRAWPRWSQFPATPKNVPTQAEFATRVAETQAAQAELLASAAQIRWTLSGTEAWAAQARALIDPTLATPAPPNSAAEAEALAKALRELATPPPPAK